MLSTLAQIIPPQYPNNKPSLAIVGLAGFSGSGKTTLLSQLITLFKNKGLRLGIIKHSHHDIEMDTAGKDSFKLRHAGAAQLTLSCPKRIIHFTERSQVTEPCLYEAISSLELSQLDLILVEGFKHEAFSKIEIYRPKHNKPLLCEKDPSIIAVASDDLSLALDLPLLDLNEPKAVADYILNLL